MDQVIDALRELERTEIPYCLLRNYQFLLGGSVGSDVDLAIRQVDRARTESVLSSVGFHRAMRRPKRRHTFFKKHVGDGRVIKLDVSWEGSEYNGLPTVNIERLIENRRRLNGCWVPAKEDYFVQIVFHGALKKNGYRPSYARDLEQLRHKVDRTKVTRHARELFGASGVTAIEHALRGNLDRIPPMKPRLVIANCLQRPRQIPEFLYVLGYENNLRSWLDRLRIPFSSSRTPIVAVTGPDGAGKSTLTERAVTELENRGYQVKLVKLGLTNDSAILMDVMKRLYNRFTGYDVEEVKRLESRGEKTLGERDGFHKAVIHYLDILIRFQQARRSNADIILADRFIHDVGIYDTPGPLAATFEWFESERVFPFLLTGDAESLAGRSEYTIDSLTELVERYEQLEFERLDATNEPDRIYEEFIEKLFSKEQFVRCL